MNLGFVEPKFYAVKGGGEVVALKIQNWVQGP